MAVATMAWIFSSDGAQALKMMIIKRDVVKANFFTGSPFHVFSVSFEAVSIKITLYLE
jgi:hypothetical protein